MPQHPLGRPWDATTMTDAVVGFREGVGPAPTVRRVTGKVREDRRLRILRRTGPNTGVLERGLHVLELMLAHEDLGVPSKQPSEEVFTRAPRANTDLTDRRFERLVVAKPSPPESLLDRGVEVVRQVLGDTTRTVTPNARHPEHFALFHTCAEENGKDLDDLKIFFTNAFVPCGAEQPERHVDALERDERYAYLFSHLGERAI